jgi:transposase
MQPVYYIGLDVHKQKISYCVKDSSGKIYAEGWIPATRFDLDRWMKTLPQPWSAAMEATMFTGWIYDHLKPHAAELKVAHPLMLRAIAAAKKKNDRIDANKICDCLRCDFLPECYMAPTAIRERRCTLRYRNLLVRQMVQMKIKTSTLLMEAGVSYNKQKLHQAGYFRELLASNPDIHEGLRGLLRLCRETVVRLSKTENALVSSLQQDPLLLQRVEQLMSIPAIGPITALTWALEVGEVQRFSSIKKAISYCGLCGDEQRSANSVQRTPIPEQKRIVEKLDEAFEGIAKANLTFAEANAWRDRFAAVPFEDKGGYFQARYYHDLAIERVMEAIVADRPRTLLTLATGTGKTFIAFQIAWKLFQSRWNLSREPSRRPRILFLADRNILADQAYNAFSAFPEDALARIEPGEIRKKGKVPKNSSLFFTIFQTFMSGPPKDGQPSPYLGEYPPDFFDFIVIDECHRGGANDESNWRGILEYFEPAVQLGLTAIFHPNRRNPRPIGDGAGE